jgi:hypothetical protein
MACSVLSLARSGYQRSKMRTRGAIEGAGARPGHPTDPDPLVAELTELQAQYAAWLEALPINQQDGALADALQAINGLDSPNSRLSTHHAGSVATDHLPLPTSPGACASGPRSKRVLPPLGRPHKAASSLSDLTRRLGLR